MNKIEEMFQNGFSARKISDLLDLKFEDVQKIIKDNNYSLSK